MVVGELMIYSVFVKPGSKKGPLVVEATLSSELSIPSFETSRPITELTVYLREKPVDGAANTALVKLLAEYFQVAKSCVVIKTGANSRHKIIEIL